MLPPCALTSAELIFVLVLRKDFFPIEEGVVQVGEHFTELEVAMFDLKIECAVG